ncbi:MAG: 50S ribosomal protein L29 [Pseudomonadota bacterium]
MKAAELRQKSTDELNEMLVQLKKEAFNLRFRAATSQVEDTSRIRAVRRDVARVKTIITERDAQEAAQAADEAAA